MNIPAFIVHVPATPGQPLVLDSPHSGFVMPADFGSVRTAAELRALVWRTLDDGRPIYDRKLSLAEVQQRIERCHRPYHVQALLDAAHARFGVVYHLNCHSMNAVSCTWTARRSCAMAALPRCGRT